MTDTTPHPIGLLGDLPPLPPLPVPNVPLLRKAVEWAEAEAAKTDGPRLWDQEQYARATDCGTAYCIAGYAVSVQPGYSETRVVRDSGCDCSACWGYVRTAVLPYIDGVEVDFSTHAQQVLGLTDDESWRLFSGYNTITEVREAAQEIAARAGERL